MRLDTRESHPPYLRAHQEGVTLDLRVQPRSSKPGFSGPHGERLGLRIQAPPVEGAANKACAVFLSKFFGISKSKVILLRGRKSREKTFLLEGVTPKEVRAALEEGSGR